MGALGWALFVVVLVALVIALIADARSGGS